MKTLKLPLILLVLSALVFVLSVLYFGNTLPEKLAVHFDVVGHPNGWMTQRQHTGTILSLGFGLVVFLLALFYSFRFFPSSCLNVPNPAFWRQPANYRIACDFLFREALLLAANFMIFFTGIHFLIIKANQQTTVALPFAFQALVIGIFLLLQILWVVDISLYFRKSVSDKTA